MAQSGKKSKDWKEEGRKGKHREDSAGVEELEKKDEASEFSKRIGYLEEELRRKQREIDRLKEENRILFNTAVKRSEDALKEKPGKPED